MEEHLELEQNPDSENVALSPRLTLHLSRGFLLVFWSLPITFLLASGIVQLPLALRSSWPSHVLGLLVGGLGLLLLSRVKSLTPLWPQRLREALGLLIVHLWLSPFWPWWRNHPSSFYYAFNVLVLVLLTAATFYVLNQLAAELARGLREPLLLAEAKLAAIIAFCATLPLTMYVMMHTLAPYRVASFHTAFWLRLRVPLVQVLDLLAPLPLVITAVVLWRARSLILSKLTGESARRAAIIQGGAR